MSNHQFETNIPELIGRLGVNLYNDPYICVRELVQNASDACLIAEGLLGKERGRIDIDIDTNDSSIVITDTGIGMKEQDLHNYLSTIATSHKGQIRSDLADSFQGSAGIAGRFGIGFLSVFIVSRDVQVRTRHQQDRGNGYLWRSSGDGSYTVTESDNVLPKGTSVRVALKPESVDLLNSRQLISTLRKHCPFIRTPYYVNRSALSINHDLPPWHESAGEQAGASYLLSEYRCDPLVEFRFQYDGPWALNRSEEDPNPESRGSASHPAKDRVDRVRVSGYFAIPNRRMRGDNQCGVYTSGIYVGSVQDSLPSWASFIVGGAECPDLDLTLGRDNVMNNKHWRAAQEIISRELIAAIVTSLGDERRKNRRAWSQVFQVHREEILRAAESDNSDSVLRGADPSRGQFFDAIRDLIPFKIGGDWLTVDEAISQGHALDDGERNVLFYKTRGKRRHESAGVQERILFEEAGLSFIDANNYYDRDVLELIDRARDDVEITRAEEAVPSIVREPANPVGGDALVELFKAIGVEARMSRFQPASLSAIIALNSSEGYSTDEFDASDPDSVQRLIQAISSGGSRVAGRPYILHLNEPNLLVTRVSEYVATSGGDALSTQVLRQIYYSAVMVFGDSDLSTLAEIVPSTASTTMSFFSHLDESERELKRVRELLDDSRLVQQSISDRLQVYEPLDVERPSIFLSHSFDKHTMAQSNSFKRLLSELPLDVVNGPAEEIGHFQHR